MVIGQPFVIIVNHRFLVSSCFEFSNDIEILCVGFSSKCLLSMTLNPETFVQDGQQGEKLDALTTMMLVLVIVSMFVFGVR